MGLQEDFKKVTNNKFSYLKFTSVTLNKDIGSLQLVAVYDCNVIKYKQIEEIKPEIFENLSKIIPKDFSFSIEFVRGRFSSNDVIEAVLGYFFKASALISSSLSKENISVSIEDGITKIQIKCNDSILAQIEKRGYAEDLEKYLDLTGFTKHKVSLDVLDEDIEEINENLERERLTVKYKYEREGGRSINPTNRTKIGKYLISTQAAYICDQHEPGAVTLYGKVIGAQLKTYKDRKDSSIIHSYVTFTLDDTTGRLRCTYFDKKSSEELAKFIENDIYIIASGKLAFDSYANDGSLSFTINYFSKCDKCDFEINKVERLPADKYYYVFPSEYKSYNQSSFLITEHHDSEVKNIVLFDCTTASFSGKEIAPIIQISAVKLIDGAIKETFSTFIDPKINISPKISYELRLRQSDILGKPTFDKAISDFHRFFYGYKLAAIPFKENHAILDGILSKLYIKAEYEDVSQLISKSTISDASKKRNKLDYLITIAKAIETY